MDKVQLASWIIQEDGCTDMIQVYRIGDMHVVECENRDELDTIREEYLRSRSDTRRKEIAKEYEKLAAEFNARHENQRYFKTLVI